MIFRDGRVPKDSVVIDANGPTVVLRGEVQRSEQIDHLVRRTEEIPEVERVDNLLHLPDQPAPTRADAPEPRRSAL